MQLGNAQTLDIALASQRLQAAAAQLQGSRALWLPSLVAGTDYYRHDGQIQDVAGNVFGTSKQAFMVGGNPTLTLSTNDALFSPLALRQVARAREHAVRAATNDALLAVAEAYFTVQQARGELAGAADTVVHTEELLRRVEKLAPGLVPALEISRTRAELARRRQSVYLAQNHWRRASAELVRVLHLDPTVVVEPLEPPELQVTLMPINDAVDSLIPLALTYRPELSAQQALVQATLHRLKQERLRPVMPSVLLRGFSTPVAGSLAGGYFGGGLNSSMGNFSAREDWDLQVLWQLQNMGFGTQAIVREKAADNRAALLELYRVQDRVAAEVVAAYADAQTSAERIRDAESELKYSRESVELNLLGLSHTKRAGDINLLVVRPQEVVASVQALSQAYLDYYSAVADFNRAQFRLYRALGQPARRLLADAPDRTRQWPKPSFRPEQEKGSSADTP